ncbi:MAG: hypothetical protein ABW136_00355 [Steroidobacteraceae bacterium]
MIPASPATARGFGYVSDILDLAESLSASASRARNIDYAAYCRQAARDFHDAAVRRLARIEWAGERHEQFIERATELDASLTAIGA